RSAENCPRLIWTAVRHTPLTATLSPVRSCEGTFFALTVTRVSTRPSFARIGLISEIVPVSWISPVNIRRLLRLRKDRGGSLPRRSLLQTDAAQRSSPAPPR